MNPRTGAVENRKFLVERLLGARRSCQYQNDHHQLHLKSRAWRCVASNLQRKPDDFFPITRERICKGSPMITLALAGDLPGLLICDVCGAFFSLAVHSFARLASSSMTLSQMASASA